MRVLIALFMLILLGACTSSNKSYSPEAQLSEREQKEILYTTVRYLGHLPKKGTHENKFNADFDEYYSKLALDFTLEAYHKKNGYEYFLVSRIAPSFKVKKVATGVKMKRDANGEVTYYEEVFRTWKFEVPEMLEKGLMLFDKMVQEQDLSPYYNANSGEEEFIEFPDGKIQYDTVQRRWIVKEPSEVLTQK
ncbi:hypothetical protein A33Q_2666 [Indibacter alkaliphilus LW1]|jgi:hypothetical protein|uniref:Uncharacterized protein n=1 Tax=Indibacter alkaliphilus (strain CCUG 57479 / KCTC 22604 / LW1) TaxID=1189612 RepID=S2E1Y8_INDAL|nr:hypothetical protein [Indibacter alkaliphilus]EOZ96073.1 hypothetical protein A33Q_2666 [Indibacter alkaliphilus LW1]